LEEFSQPLVQRDLRLEAEDEARLRWIGVAVGDVSGARFLVDRDQVVPARREDRHAGEVVYRDWLLRGDVEGAKGYPRGEGEVDCFGDVPNVDEAPGLLPVPEYDGRLAGPCVLDEARDRPRVVVERLPRTVHVEEAQHYGERP